MSTTPKLQYRVLDSTTGNTIGMFTATSERGARTMAAKLPGVEYRWTAAIVEVQTFEFETADGVVTSPQSWIEREYGDESDHWTRTTHADDEASGIAAARQMILDAAADGYSIQDRVTVVTATPWTTPAPAPEAPVDGLADWERAVMAPEAPAPLMRMSEPEDLKCGCEHVSHFPEDDLGVELIPATGHAYLGVPAGEHVMSYVGAVCDTCNTSCRPRLGSWA